MLAKYFYIVLILSEVVKNLISKSSDVIDLKLNKLHNRTFYFNKIINEEYLIENIF